MVNRLRLYPQSIYIRVGLEIDIVTLILGINCWNIDSNNIDSKKPHNFMKKMLIPRPLLVENLIDWYKWYIRWSMVSDECGRRYAVHEHSIENIIITWLSIKPYMRIAYNIRTVEACSSSQIYSCDGKKGCISTLELCIFKWIF